MDDLRRELNSLEERGNFDKTIDHVQAAIDVLVKAKSNISQDPSTAAVTLAGLKKPVKESFDKINGDLKEVYSVQNKFGKAIDRKFKGQPSLSDHDDALSDQTLLINRAIAMHLLREGKFGVAQTFVEEINTYPPTASRETSAAPTHSWEFKSENLEKQFGDMYRILHELRQRSNLEPAIQWARKHRNVLESRASNLEFELCRLEYVRIYLEDVRAGQCPLGALAYARSEFSHFKPRYENEVAQLAAAQVFFQRLETSPYQHLFLDNNAWEDVANTFTKEFCSMLGLSADSPLYVAATAGAIALPVLNKVRGLMVSNRTEWTTAQEMPAEVPLPPSYQFHSIFVCPVSKEQATDKNPPVMMPCGHVICKESLDKISKGTRFKCPYCPMESTPSQARKVYL
ncbi:regulator of gluconeogenesis rmd5 [Venturia nashicola]|uniref:GID complex catalytic subunit 2 n=1 Tax=Venturia nashicola TaxID=86259 RepID=A0A4Z1PEC2_9PEZI|nr:regulator of gluconeogenesis rmd5 [Venturia nashicola]TLD38793.1 regulator of gluconeogenesis rmd5 [Venturia nashicola]